MFRERRGSLLVVCGLLLLAVVAVYGQTAGHDFVGLDDGEFAYENRHVLAGLSQAGVVWAFTTSEVSAQWQPLTLLSLMADAQWVKPPQGPPDRARLAETMHLTNLALHALNALLLFLVLRAMTFLPRPYSGEGQGVRVSGPAPWWPPSSRSIRPTFSRWPGSPSAKTS